MKEGAWSLRWVLLPFFSSRSLLFPIFLSGFWVSSLFFPFPSLVSGFLLSSSHFPLWFGVWGFWFFSHLPYIFDIGEMGNTNQLTRSPPPLCKSLLMPIASLPWKNPEVAALLLLKFPPAAVLYNPVSPTDLLSLGHQRADWNTPSLSWTKHTQKRVVQNAT